MSKTTELITLQVTPSQLKLLLQIFKYLALTNGKGCPELYRYLLSETRRYQAMKREQQASMKRD